MTDVTYAPSGHPVQLPGIATNLVCFMGTFAAIDFETATPERSSACAVGLVIVEDWKVVDGRAWLIQPPGNKYKTFNTNIHGLDPSSTAASPPFAEVWREVEVKIDGRLVIAHNTAFDISVLRRSAELTGLAFAELQFACTYRLAKSTWPDRWSYRLDEMAEDFDIELEHHDPLSDASAAAALAAHICNAHGVGSLGEVCDALGYRLGSLKSCVYSGMSNASPSSVGYSRSFSALEATTDDIAPDIPLFGKVVAFTGTLGSMTRIEAAQIAVNCGAKPTNSISSKVDFLVTGVTEFWRVKDGSSSKMRKAIALAKAGHDIEIIDEADFWNLVDG